MNEQELKYRTKSFALRILKLIDALPDKRSARVIANQLGRAGTSVGANYRSACRARSLPDMLSKLGIVEEEVDESSFWLELIIEHRLLPARQVQALVEEADELTAIMVASRKTLDRNQKSKIGSQKSR